MIRRTVSLNPGHPPPGTKVANLCNYVCPALFSLALCVPTVFATTVIGIKTPFGFVIAVDSKPTYRGPGNKGPAVVCKIVQSGPLYFAIAGLAGDRDRGFLPDRIVASNFSTADSLARNIERIDRAISDALIIEMKRLKTEAPDEFAYNQRPGGETLMIIAGEMVNGTPHMFGRGFRYIDNTMTVAISRKSCPGDCANGAYFFFAGETDVAQRTLPEFSQDGAAHDPVTDARKLVEVEIQASPENVGPPITILRVDKDSASWVSNDSGCPSEIPPPI
jgi:hypothetical protein